MSSAGDRPLWSLWLSPVVSFVVSFFVRFLLISLGPYHVDCLNLALQAQKTLETHQLQFAFGSGYPLNVLLAAVFIGISEFFGCHDAVWSVNLMSVVFGALGTAAFYVFLRLIFDEKAAWLGAALFCFNPVLWGTSVYGMNHSPSLFFLIAGLCFLFSFLKNGSHRYFLLGAVFIGFMGATRLQDMILVTPAIIYAGMFLKEGQYPQKFRAILTFFIVAGAIVAAFHLPYVFNGHQSSAYGQQWQEYWKQGFTQFDGRMLMYFPNALEDLVESFSLFGIILAAAGMFLIFRDEPKFAVFLLIWCVIPLLFFGSLAGIAPRFLVVILPVVLVSQVYALSLYMNGPVWMRCVLWAVWAALIIQSMTLMYPILNYRHQRSEIIRSSEWVNRITPPDSVVFAGDEGPFIAHFGKREVLKPPVCWGGCTQEQFLDFKSKVRELTSQGRGVYMTSMGLQADDPDGEFQKFVSGNFRLVLVGKCWTEDWHHDCMVLRLGWVKLYRITPN